MGIDVTALVTALDAAGCRVVALQVMRSVSPDGAAVASEKVQITVETKPAVPPVPTVTTAEPYEIGG